MTLEAVVSTYVVVVGAILYFLVKCFLTDRGTKM